MFAVLSVSVGILGASSLIPATFAAMQLFIWVGAPRPFECPHVVALHLLLLVLPLSCFYSLNMAVSRFRDCSLLRAYLWLLVPVAHLVLAGGLFLAAIYVLPPCVGGKL